MKFFYLALSICLTATVLVTGCGGNNQNPTPGNGAAGAIISPISPINPMNPGGYVPGVIPNTQMNCASAGMVWNPSYNQCVPANTGNCFGGASWTQQYGGGCLAPTLPSGAYQYNSGFVYGNYYCTQPYGITSGYVCYPMYNNYYYAPYNQSGSWLGLGFRIRI